jgi:hypothetical protein
VFKYVLLKERMSLILAGIFAIGFLIIAPNEPQPRSWWASYYALLLPVLVLGRSRLRARDGWLLRTAKSRARTRLVLTDWILNILYVMSFAFAVGRSDWLVVLAAGSWGAAVIAISDFMDRAFVHPGRAWVMTLTLLMAVCLAPLILGHWYSRTILAPHLATYAVGLHPSALILSAYGLPTLQDPLLYKTTLLGVTWVEPMHWMRGIGIYFLFAVVSFGWSVLHPVRMRAAQRFESC